MAERGREQQRELEIVVIGKTGTGKSSFCNTLTRGHANRAVGGGGKSVTSATSWVRGEIDGQRFRVWDTPGIYDTRPGQDQKNISDMVKQLKGKDVDLFCLVFNAEDPRLTPMDVGLYSLFSEIFASPNRTWMENCCVVFTHWETGEEADEEREDGNQSMADLEANWKAAALEHTNFAGRPSFVYIDNKVFRKSRSGRLLRSPEQTREVESELKNMIARAVLNKPFSCADIAEAQDFIAKLRESEAKMKEQNKALQKQHREQQTKFDADLERLRSDLRSKSDEFEEKVRSMKADNSRLQDQIEDMRSRERDGGLSLSDLLPLFMALTIGNRSGGGGGGGGGYASGMPMIMSPGPSRLGGGGGGPAITDFAEEACAPDPMGWNEFRSAHAGEGLTMGTGSGSMSEAYHAQSGMGGGGDDGYSIY